MLAIDISKSNLAIKCHWKNKRTTEIVEKHEPLNINPERVIDVVIENRIVV